MPEPPASRRRPRSFPACGRSRRGARGARRGGGARARVLVLRADARSRSRRSSRTRPGATPPRRWRGASCASTAWIPSPGRASRTRARASPTTRACAQAKPQDASGIPGFSYDAARYVIEQGGPAAFRQLAERQLPLAYWVVRFFQPEKKEEWKVLIDARRARVVAFVNPIGEDAPAAPPPSDERTRAAARSRPPASSAIPPRSTRSSRSAPRRGPGAWTRRSFSRRSPAGSARRGRG